MSKARTCETCKHRSEYGCLGEYVCELLTYSKSNLAEVEDGCGGNAMLLVHNDFGCVLWEIK